MSPVGTRAGGRRGAGSVSLVMEGARTDYLAARRDPRQRRRRGLPALGAGADYHWGSESERLYVIELIRDMERNDMLIPQAIDRAVDVALGDGFQLDPKSGSEDLNERLAAKWKSWAEDPDACDLAKEHDFNGLARLAYRGALRDGDTIGIGTRSGALELHEAHRCQTPVRTTRNVVGGVLLDETTRERLEYWFTKEEINPRQQARLVGETTPVPTRSPRGNRQVFHVYNPRRLSQTRGVSALIPATTPAAYYEDLSYAMLVKQQIAAVFAVLREVADSDTSEGENEGEGGPGRTGGTIDPERPEIEPGMEYTGRPGEKLHFGHPNIPNPEFFQQIKHMAEMVGLNLGLPLIMLLMDASQTNFSGWRGAFEIAKYGFRSNQSWLERRFHRQVYAWKVRQWLAQDDELRALADEDGVDPFAHAWKRPAWPYIEPNKDAQADNLRATTMQSSRRRIVADRGLDYDDLVTEMIEDNERLVLATIEAAKRINDKHPEAQISWRELLGVLGNVKDAEAIATMAGGGSDRRDNKTKREDE